jgi:hypothetical protein
LTYPGAPPPLAVAAVISSVVQANDICTPGGSPAPNGAIADQVTATIISPAPIACPFQFGPCNALNGFSIVLKKQSDKITWLSAPFAVPANCLVPSGQAQIVLYGTLVFGCHSLGLPGGLFIKDANNPNPFLSFAGYLVNASINPLQLDWWVSTDFTTLSPLLLVRITP